MLKHQQAHLVRLSWDSRAVGLAVRDRIVVGIESASADDAMDVLGDCAGINVWIQSRSEQRAIDLKDEAVYGNRSSAYFVARAPIASERTAHVDCRDIRRSSQDCQQQWEDLR